MFAFMKGNSLICNERRLLWLLSKIIIYLWSLTLWKTYSEGGQQGYFLIEMGKDPCRLLFPYAGLSQSTFLHHFILQCFNLHKEVVRLNPKKCKEMVINPLQYTPFPLVPLDIRGASIERVHSYKILGIILSHDLT